MSNFILGLGCSFTWGESLYFYSDIPNLPFIEYHKYESDKVTPEMIKFKNNNRYLKLLSDELNLPYFFPFDKTNGGSIVGSVSSIQFDIRTKYKDAKYVIWQLSDWTRDFNFDSQNIKDYDMKTMTKMVDGHIQRTIHFIKYIIDEFEKNGSTVILFSWTSDIVSHPLYKKFFIDTDIHMDITCEGKVFKSFDKIIQSEKEIFQKYTVAYDFKDIGMLKNDTHFNMKGQELLKNNILEKIKQINKKKLI